MLSDEKLKVLAREHLGYDALPAAEMNFARAVAEAAVRAEREGAVQPGIARGPGRIWLIGYGNMHDAFWHTSPKPDGSVGEDDAIEYVRADLAIATVPETDPRYQHLLDMLGAKNHEDAARIIAGHHARELGEATVPEGWKLVRYDEKRVFIQMDSRFLIVRKASPDPAWRALYQLVMHMVGRGILAAAHNTETTT